MIRRNNTISSLVLAATLLGVAGLAAPAAAQGIAYQAELVVGGQKFTGTAQMRFAILQGGTTLWSNDGTSVAGGQPAAAVPTAVVDGIFSARLGVAPMVALTPAMVAGASTPVLRVWADVNGTIEQLPDQPIPASAFALTSKQLETLTPNRVPRWNGLALADGLIVDTGANVGIGTSAPTSKLTVVGTIASTTGGLRFPDGSIQVTRTVQGPQGPQGPQGLAGPVGSTGPIGSVGPAGPTGPTGAAGPTGSSAPFTIDASGDAIFNTATNVGVGTATPGAKLTVVEESGSLPMSAQTGSADASKVIIENTSTAGTGSAWSMAVTGATNATGTRKFQISPSGASPLMSVTSTGVGLLTTAPESRLHVQKGSAGSVTSNGNAVMTLENSTNAYLNILAPDISNQALAFGNPTDGSFAGSVVYNSAITPDGMQFHTNGNVNRAVIDAAGNLGIGSGATAPDAKLHVTGGTAISGADGGYMLIGTFTGLHMAWDQDQIQVANDNTFGTLTLQRQGGNIGIGTLAPAEKLTSTGRIESITGVFGEGGMKFPDGTTNTTARFTSNVQGPQGPDGIRGPDGFQGPVGASPQGPQGPQGPRGAIGPPANIALCGVSISCGIGWSRVGAQGNHPCTANPGAPNASCTSAAAGHHCIVCAKN